jgi:ribosomal protein S1
MKKFLLPLALVLVAGVGVAQAADTKPAEKAPAKAAAPAKAMHKTHVVEGEVVSTDATAKTITVKVAGEDKTVPVHGKAAARLSSLKAGEKVALTCVDNEKGEHLYASAIKVQKAAASTTAPAKTTAKAKKSSSK